VSVGPRQDTRLRIIAAAYGCVARDGLAATTLDAAATEAGVARATVYRYFPGGRDELISATVAWEVGRFFERIRHDVGDVDGVAAFVERALGAAHRRLAAHEVLQHALQQESDRLLPPLASVMHTVVTALQDELAVRLAAEELRPGVDADQAADLLARMMLSFMGTPGSWDLDDPASVHRLVRRWLLAGVLPCEPAPSGREPPAS
jgi:AcrR family transcriptional regulator